MASPVIDGLGNIGIGYSFGGKADFPGQRFAGRLSDRIAAKWVVATGFLLVSISVTLLALASVPALAYVLNGSGTFGAAGGTEAVRAQGGQLVVYGSGDTLSAAADASSSASNGSWSAISGMPASRNIPPARRSMSESRA